MSPTLKFKMYIYLYTFILSANIFVASCNASVMVEQYILNEAASPAHQSNHNELQSMPQSFCVNSTTKVFNVSLITCTQSGPLLRLGYCATYDAVSKLLSIADCPYSQSSGYEMTTDGYIRLPRNLSQLNEYMCAPLNRKGIVCSECADGFGPSVTSFGYKCANCTNVWYGVPLFLFLEFVPITVFFIIILAFRISVTSPPMPCFIAYAQCIVVGVYLSVFSDNDFKFIVYNNQDHLRLDMKIIHTLYGVFNLDFLRLVLPTFCISSHFRSIHLAFLGYISVFYPLVLIFLTWLCVELHGRNVRPLVWLWRPFHRCFVRLRRGWDTKSNIIDVFITFFLLSYSKCMYVTMLLMSSEAVRSYDDSGIAESFTTKRRAIVDLGITAGSRDHLTFVIPAAIIFLLYNILLPVLLTLYPFKSFRMCLSKCRLNFIALNILIEKVQSCYRNGLDGGRDMRSFSGLYFFLRMLVFLVGELSYRFLKVNDSIWLINEIWFPVGTVFLATGLTVALIQPYQRAYMNYLDALLLCNLALFHYVLTSHIPVLVIIRILFLIPISMLVLFTISRIIFKSSNLQGILRKCCKNYNFRKCVKLKSGHSQILDNRTLQEDEKLPFAHSASSTETSYGIKVNSSLLDTA